MCHPAAGASSSAGRNRLQQEQVMTIAKLIQRSVQRILGRPVSEQAESAPSAAPSLVCAYGHPVFAGNNLCTYGHRAT
jgi:hypothetical protein